MSSKPRILFAGCSYTDGTGFTVENRSKYNWTNLFANHYECDHDNIAIGGASNDEIFYRTLDTLITNKQQYNLVIVMWTSLDRHWQYFKDQNIDDYVIMNPTSLAGFFPGKTHRTMAETYRKIHHAYFSHTYINLKHWLLKVIALESFLKMHNINYMFYKGFPNLVKQFSMVNYTTDYGFTDLDNELKNMLDFNNRPDDYIFKKVQNIQTLINNIDQNNFVNILDNSFEDLTCDVADDNLHPGRSSNQILANILIKNCDHMQLLQKSN